MGLVRGFSEVVSRSEQPACECWFLDVGQGTSNVVLLGKGRAIVIDCGPRGSEQTIQLLTREHIHTIEALIVSHNDSDHDYNVGQVLHQYRKATRRIFFLQDRAVHNSMPTTFGVLKRSADGDFPSPERLETNAGTAKKLFSQDGVVLSILYPDLMANLEAQGAGRSNQTSAVLRLTCGGRRVVFSGDATIEAWEWLARKLPEAKPLLCDIMTIPHHGGTISDSQAGEATYQRRLYTDLIQPEFGIVSVGTINPYGHPSVAAIRALRDTGVTVLCTQMTQRCCGDLEAIRSSRGVFSMPSRSTETPSTTCSQKSRHVACFGSIVAEISESHVKIANLKRHEQAMEAFSKSTSFNPLCRPGNSASA
ncbi:MAG: MBL fold metallo-hydrolase [Phycisphaerae bacterium]|nr:MBL fold metallo-hydrolase [Phycisphaerae bacterium]